MALNYVLAPHDYYALNTKGAPVANGFIYVGEPDTDPEFNQKQVIVRQEDGTEVAVTQPLTTNAGGKPQYSGAPVQLLVDGNYSIKVLSSGLVQVDYVENAFNGVPVTTDTFEENLVLSKSVAIIFSNYADLVSGTLPNGSSISLIEGQSARILGRVTEGDAGQNSFVIGVFGTADSVTIVDLDSGLQGYALFPDGEYNSVQCGVTGDGSTDDTAAMLVLDALAEDRSIEIIGTVVFTGANLEHTYNYTFSEGSSIVDVRGQQIVMLDDDGKTVIGLQHNHLLEDDATLGSNLAQTSGNINPPPVAVPFRSSDIDVLAYWYQDFGLEYTRDGDGANGSLTWYYWDWNFATNTGDGVTTMAYNEDRRPTLGYYRGDDANVLGWQCYWLAKYGVTGSILQQREGAGYSGYGTMTSRWDSFTDVNHWIYQLVTNTPNFTSLQYQLWGYSSFLPNTVGNQSIYRESWTEVITNIYLIYKNFHYIEKDGEIYPCLFMFEGKGPSTTFGTETETKDFYIEMAALFKSAGYAGMAIMARNPETTFIGDSYLETNGVLYFSADYSNIDSTGDSTDYQDYFVDNLDFDVEDQIRGIANTMTSKKYVYPHPSTGFDTDGFTPDLFRRAVAATAEQIASTDAPKVMTIYNVSEWAEGGPALQPNIQDGFEWLEALNNGLRNGSKSKALKMGVSTDVLLWKGALAGSERVQNLDPNSASILRVQTDFSTDEVSSGDRLPNIIAGKDGQVCRLLVAGSHTFRLVDDAVAAGTGLMLSQLGGAGSLLTLTPGQYAEFVYSSDDSLWICTSTTGTPS